MKKQIYIAFALTLFAASILAPVFGYWLIALAAILMALMISIHTLTRLP